MKNSKSPMMILGIETSCDDTAVSVIEGNNNKIRVLSSVVSSQAKLHAKWGGVVPSLAAREHLKNIIPVLELGLKEACVTPANIDVIAVTQGPGLIPALLVGTSFAKTLSYVWQKPLLGIHHIEGHIYANFIHPVEYRDALAAMPLFHRVKFPILCLVVSGGHTQLILMKKHLDYRIVGETLDDAAGEAFDKVARILGLGYPGGPAIAAEAAKFETNSKYKIQNSKQSINLPRPMINKDNLNFSFSGLKTAVLYETKKYQGSTLKIKKVEPWKIFMCAEFQQAAIDVLISKTLKAAKIYKPKTIMLAGGVSANLELRKQLGAKIHPVKSAKGGPASRELNRVKKISYITPDVKYSIDNAAMIAAAGYWRWKSMNPAQRKNSLQNWKKLQPDANLKLK